MGSMKVSSAIIFFVLFMFVFTRGYAHQCRISDIKVSITKTGKVVEGAPEWNVAISNGCHCPQSNVYVKCTGFASYLPINPAIFKVEGNKCLIKGGKQIVQGLPVTFKFAFVTPFDIVPLKSTIAC